MKRNSCNLPAVGTASHAAKGPPAPTLANGTPFARSPGKVMPSLLTRQPTVAACAGAGHTGQPEQRDPSPLKKWNPVQQHGRRLSVGGATGEKVTRPSQSRETDMANKTRDTTFPARTHHGNAAVLQLGVTEPHDSLVGDRRRDAERVKHLAKSLGTYTLPAQMQAARHGGWAGSQRAQGEATDCCAVSDTRSRGHGAPSLRAIQRRAAVHILSTSAIFGTATRAEPATGMAGAFMRAGAMRAGTIIAMVICQGGEDPRVGACRGTGRRRGRAYR